MSLIQPFSPPSETPSLVPPVTVTLTVDDIAYWNYFQQWLTPAAGLRAALLVLICVGVSLAVWIVFGGGVTTLNLVGGALMGLAVVPWRRWLGWKGAAHKQVRATPSILEPVSHTALPQGLLSEARGERVLRPWPTFVALVDADQSLYFTTITGVALLFPRRCFPSPAASQQFYEYCRVLAETAKQGKETASVPGA